eukprot:3581181-Rhodomonas_salina.2
MQRAGACIVAASHRWLPHHCPANPFKLSALKRGLTETVLNLPLKSPLRKTAMSNVNFEITGMELEERGEPN